VITPSPEERLAELDIVLPEPPAPAAAYVPFVRTGNLIFVSGQVAAGEGGLVATGKVGDGVDLETAVSCARQCAINVLAQLKAAVGELGNVRRVVKLTVFVAADPTFTEPHKVANGASELFGDVFGEAGRHARSAVGAPALPLDTPVEVEAIVEVV
jgi:enamine deaminase RidA (YjgF/YER057c/UK114 family)